MEIEEEVHYEGDEPLTRRVEDHTEDNTPHNQDHTPKGNTEDNTQSSHTDENNQRKLNTDEHGETLRNQSVERTAGDSKGRNGRNISREKASYNRGPSKERPKEGGYWYEQSSIQKQIIVNERRENESYRPIRRNFSKYNSEAAHSDRNNPLRYRVICRNLEPHIQWKDLKVFGEKVAAVNFATVVSHNKELVGVIEFINKHGMETCLRELDGAELLGVRMRVTPDFDEIKLPPRRRHGGEEPVSSSMEDMDEPLHAGYGMKRGDRHHPVEDRYHRETPRRLSNEGRPYHHEPEIRHHSPYYDHEPRVMDSPHHPPPHRGMNYYEKPSIGYKPHPDDLEYVEDYPPPSMKYGMPSEKSDAHYHPRGMNEHHRDLAPPPHRASRHEPPHYRRPMPYDAKESMYHEPPYYPPQVERPLPRTRNVPPYVEKHGPPSAAMPYRESGEKRGYYMKQGNNPHYEDHTPMEGYGHAPYRHPAASRPMHKPSRDMGVKPYNAPKDNDSGAYDHGYERPKKDVYSRHYMEGNNNIEKDQYYKGEMANEDYSKSREIQYGLGKMHDDMDHRHHHKSDHMKGDMFMKGKEDTLRGHAPMDKPVSHGMPPQSHHPSRNTYHDQNDEAHRMPKRINAETYNNDNIQKRSKFNEGLEGPNAPNVMQESHMMRSKGVPRENPEFLEEMSGHQSRRIIMSSSGEKDYPPSGGDYPQGWSKGHRPPPSNFRPYNKRFPHGGVRPGASSGRHPPIDAGHYPSEDHNERPAVVHHPPHHGGQYRPNIRPKRGRGRF